MDQLGLFGSIIQTELPLDVPQQRKRGNPSFKPKFKAGKTTAVRIPSVYVEKIFSLISEWDQLYPSGDLLGTDEPVAMYSGIQVFPVSLLRLDPERFQYKICYGKTGSTGSLSGVSFWDENLAGVILVWQDPSNGIVYVINGHNRVTLAQSLNVENLTVRFLACETSIEARMIGALANVAEGRGTALDAAKLFRDYGITRSDLAERGIPLREKIASDGLALSKLEKSLFNGVIQGDYSVERMVIVGDLIPDHSSQIALCELIDRESRNRRITNDLIRELAETVLASGNHTDEQCTLFGVESIQQSLALEKAELQAFVKGRLSRERKLFSTVSTAKNAADLSRGNNKIDTQSSQKIASSADSALRVFDSLKNVSSPLNDAINNAAKQIAMGSDSRKTKDSLYTFVLDELPRLMFGLSA